MNEWGKENIPFIFIIDFEMQNPLLFKLKDINAGELKYSFKNHTNCQDLNEFKNTEIHFSKQPVHLDNYRSKFEYVQKHIKVGNTYLLNLTCVTPVNLNLTLHELFQRTKAKYKILYKNNWVCFSPETFVQINNGIISTYPMKGTIDASLPDAENHIMNDPKEIAEHYTIVDLMRNDLNMVAKNVHVKRFRYVDRIQTNERDLLQISSEIEGELGPHYLEKLGDIIFTLLPAGSVSGAPKQKTVEIIKGAEGYCREYYTGICGIFDGKNLDSCVLIRFIENYNNTLIYKSGGGITASSDLMSEFNEMKDKVYVPII